MTTTPSYTRPGHHTIVPILILKDAAKAIDFYKKAFGAKEETRSLMPDGRIMHANIVIDGSHIFICDEFPEQNAGLSPQTLGNAHAALFLYVPSVDKAYQQAVDAGAKGIMPPQDMFWGDRYARLVDPFGQPWNLATFKEMLTPEEIEKRKTDCFKEMAKVK